MAMAASACPRRCVSLRNHSADRTLAYPAAAPIAPCSVCGQPAGTPATHRAGAPPIPTESTTTAVPSRALTVGTAGLVRLHGRTTSPPATTATAKAAISQRHFGRRVGPAPGRDAGSPRLTSCSSHFRGWTAGTPSARRRLAGREEGVDDDGADPDPQGAHGRDEHLALAPGDVVGDVAGHATGGQDRAPHEEPGAADQPDRGQQVQAQLGQIPAFGKQAPVRRVVDLEAPAAPALLGQHGYGRSLHVPSSTALSRPASEQTCARSLRPTRQG